uniref:M-lycotoxin-Hc1a n=1 Tax=Hogna carolinensis TaxID=278031 RepID=LYT1_HOGCA|nr:RecName: Full=M-lycotoxin-Hc1a; Short=M-LCTX-Hc1a; AltName: Full=Lycotoxin I; AltName: Full=Lycotoxin-1 [Hogna carolinensis]
IWLTALKFLGKHAAKHLAKQQLSKL